MWQIVTSEKAGTAGNLSLYHVRLFPLFNSEDVSISGLELLELYTMVFKKLAHYLSETISDYAPTKYAPQSRGRVIV